MATPLHSPKARGYDSWLGYWHHANDYWSFGEGTCADSYEGGARPQKEALVRDLWRYNGSTGFQQHAAVSGVVDGRDDTDTDIGSPALDLQNADFCSQTHQNNSNVTCVFEEQILLDRVLELINGFGARQAHPEAVKGDTSDDGMFLLWSSHLVHMPLQAPAAFVSKFSDVDDPQRKMMRAMTNFLDDAVGQMVAALEANGLWNDTLIVGHADNGG